MADQITTSVTYTLQLEGDGISVKRDINEETARRVMNILLGSSGPFMRIGPDKSVAAQGSFALEASTSRTPNSQVPATSLREYLDEVQAKRNPDKILAIGAYLVDVNGVEDFGADDIRSLFPKAGEAIPANYPRDFRWVVSSGWIAENPNDSSRFYITKTGRKAIAEKFPKELAKPQPGYAKRKKNRSRTVLNTEE